jgi:hypothetical protein
MRNLKKKMIMIKILVCIGLIVNIRLFSQITILKTYTDKSFVKDNVGSWDFNDSLSDGHYILYNNPPNIKTSLPIISGQFKFGKRQGVFLYYSSKGEKTFIKSIKNYKDGKLNGYVQNLHFVNSISLTGEYIDNKKNGEWKTYYKNGNIESIIYYNMDTLKSWNFFYINGQVKSTGTYSIYTSDTIRRYNESNKLLYEGIYSFGKLTSWRKFDTKGMTIKEAKGVFDSTLSNLMETMTSDYSCFSCLHLSPEPYNGFVIEYLGGKYVKTEYKNGVTLTSSKDL